MIRPIPIILCKDPAISITLTTVFSIFLSLSCSKADSGREETPTDQTPGEQQPVPPRYGEVARKVVGPEYELLVTEVKRVDAIDVVDPATQEKKTIYPHDVVTLEQMLTKFLITLELLAFAYEAPTDAPLLLEMLKDLSEGRELLRQYAELYDSSKLDPTTATPEQISAHYDPTEMNPAIDKLTDWITAFVQIPLQGNYKKLVSDPLIHDIAPHTPAQLVSQFWDQTNFIPAEKYTGKENIQLIAETQISKALKILPDILERSDLLEESAESQFHQLHTSLRAANFILTDPYELDWNSRTPADQIALVEQYFEGLEQVELTLRTYKRAERSNSSLSSPKEAVESAWEAYVKKTKLDKTEKYLEEIREKLAKVKDEP
jgi:hypothetical protein